MKTISNYLVFGSTGAIGSACVPSLKHHGEVICGSRDFSELHTQLSDIPGFDGVVWAQGINLEDSSAFFEPNDFESVIDANVKFIVNSLQILQKCEKLKDDSRLVILSSIWGHLGRPKKLSYSISKAAVGGLVRSLAVDLGKFGISVNSVSPGPIDSPMTVKNLTSVEVNRIISETPIKRLVTLDEVTSVVCGLVTGNFQGVTGQDIIIDGGWSVSKLI